MKPSIGRIVHYQQGDCTAAIVTRVGMEAGTVMMRDPLEPISLTIFPGAVNLGPVEHDEGKRNGTWHWPERTEG